MERQYVVTLQQLREIAADGYREGRKVAVDALKNKDYLIDILSNSVEKLKTQLSDEQDNCSEMYKDYKELYLSHEKAERTIRRFRKKLRQAGIKP